MRSRKTLFKYMIICGFSAVLALVFLLAPHVKSEKPLIIYDVHTNSPRIVKDDGSIEFSDYVRIRNVTDSPYDLTGLNLSDSRKKYDKLPLDGVTVDAGQSVMIRLDPSWNFALRNENDENIYLTDSKGNILFKYTPSMKPEEPVFSADSGFCDREFDLSISAKGDCTIYYTLDGSEPDEDSDVYTDPVHVYDRSEEPNRVVNVPNTIKNYLEEEYYDEESGTYVPVEQPVNDPVDKAFVIRAVCMDRYGNKSDVITREFFFCAGKYRNIISIVADRDDLFGPYGIVSTGAEYDDWYLNGQEGEMPSVNYHKKGREWEVCADLDYFRGNTRVLKQKCGLRLQGRTTRDRRIKNFQLRARNSYSSSDVFEYDFFDNEPYRSDAVVLDDCFKESLYYDLVDKEEIIKPKTTDRAALFINGEFWNNVYIRQKLDERYFADHFDIPEENLVVYSESFPEIGGDTQEEFDKYRAYYTALDDFAEENDLSLSENYKEMQTMMDIDSYIDYLAINTWIGAYDWAEFDNDLYWRVKDPVGEGFLDGRFRWILHDGDDVFVDILRVTDPWFLEQGPLFPNLMKNEEFKKSFADRLEELGQTTFSDESVRKVADNGKWDESELSDFVSFLSDRHATVEEYIRTLR